MLGGLLLDAIGDTESQWPPLGPRPITHFRPVRYQGRFTPVPCRTVLNSDSDRRLPDIFCPTGKHARARGTRECGTAGLRAQIIGRTFRSPVKAGLRCSVACD